MALRYAQRTDNKLLLAARQSFRCVMASHTQTKISPLRPGLGMPHNSITFDRRRQYIGKGKAFVPAPVVTQLKAFKLQQNRQSALKNRLECLYVGSSVLVDLFTRQAQLTAPGRLRSSVKCTMPEPRVTLPQGLL